MHPSNFISKLTLGSPTPNSNPDTDRLFGHLTASVSKHWIVSQLMTAHYETLERKRPCSSLNALQLAAGKGTKQHWRMKEWVNEPINEQSNEQMSEGDWPFVYLQKKQCCNISANDNFSFPHVCVVSNMEKRENFTSIKIKLEFFWMRTLNWAKRR